MCQPNSEPVNCRVRACCGRLFRRVSRLTQSSARWLIATSASAPSALTLASFVVLRLAALGKPVQSQMVVMGEHDPGRRDHAGSQLGGECRVAFDTGAKRILVLILGTTGIPSVPGELFAKFQASSFLIPRKRCSKRSERSTAFAACRHGSPQFLAVLPWKKE